MNSFLLSLAILHIEFCVFDKTEKFYDFEDINQADQDSVSGKTIKPILVIDKEYQV